jgi:hypothetical protein
VVHDPRQQANRKGCRRQHHTKLEQFSDPALETIDDDVVAVTVDHANAFQK